MTLKAAFDRLGTWTVTGVTTNYGLDDYPGEIPHAQLPALLALGGEDGRGLKPFDVAMSKGELTVYVDHLLLVAGAAMGRPQARLYDSLTLIDNYITQVKADWTLNSTLLRPLRVVSATWGVIMIGNGLYVGMTFKHEWVLAL